MLVPNIALEPIPPMSISSASRVAMGFQFSSVLRLKHDFKPPMVKLLRVVAVVRSAAGGQLYPSPLLSCGTTHRDRTSLRVS